MKGTRAGEQQRRDRTASRARQNVQSQSAFVTTARRLGNQQMGELALQAAAQRANARPLPATEREELEVEAERASEAVNDGAPREVPPDPPPPDAGGAAPGGDGGAPLPPDARAHFEARFGERFDDVRIHAGADAAREAQQLGARAFTRGSHVYFGQSADAQVGGNERLFAHELAHVVQQRHEPALAGQTFLDDKPVIKTKLVVGGGGFKVKIDRVIGGEELFIELLRQHFNVADPAIARKIIADEEFTFKKNFVVSEEDVKRGYHVVKLGEYVDMQIEHAARKYGIEPPERGGDADADPTKPKVSKELADVVKRHRELMPDEKELHVPKEDELEQLKRINAALEKLAPDQRKLFVQLAQPTADLNLYEESVRSFSELVAGAEESLRQLTRGKLTGLPTTGGVGAGGGSGVGVGGAKDGAHGGKPGDGAKSGDGDVVVDATGIKVAGKGGGDDLQGKLDATWTNVDAKAWGNLDAKGREDLAREMAAKQRNIQLKHMVTHPGETVKGMAESVVRVDKLGKDVAKDISDVADGSKSASARAAAAASAGKKISMWLSAIIVVVTIIAFIINPALTLKLWMMRAMALMIVGAVLAATEAELRIQEAIGAKDFASYQEAVQKSGSAQAEFVAAVAMAAIPLVGRLLVKIPFVGRVAGYLGKVTKFVPDKLWAARNAIAKELRDLVKGKDAAMKLESASLTKLAADLKAMAPKEFLEAIRNNTELREALGFDDATVKSLEALLNTAEGQKILGQFQKELTKSIADAPEIAQRVTEDYAAKLEETAKKIENAATPDEAKAAVDEANRILGERAAEKDLSGRGDDYKSYRLSQAAEEARLEALEREATAQRAAAEKAAAEKAVADKAAADKAASDKAAADKAAADKAAADKAAARKKAAADKAAADKAAADKAGADKAAADKAAADKAGADKAAADKAAADKAAADKAAADKAATDKPAADKPVADEAGADKPAADKPADKATADETTVDKSADKATADETAADKPAADEVAADKPADKAATNKPADKAAVDPAATQEPPPGFEKPVGKKPARGTDAGNAYRYQRYKYNWWRKNRSKPVGERSYMKTEAEYAKANFKGGRAGGANQQATRARLASEEGYINTETTQLGDRLVDGKVTKNMVDMHKPGGSDGGGTRYVEVDPMNNNGLPDPAMIDKLKAEISALKPGDDLLFVDSNNFNRRSVFKYGDDPGVVDTNPGPKAPRRPPRKPTK